MCNSLARSEISQDENKSALKPPQVVARVVFMAKRVNVPNNKKMTGMKLPYRCREIVASASPLFHTILL
jgi:hypothetical protein